MPKLIGPIERLYLKLRISGVENEFEVWPRF